MEAVMDFIRNISGDKTLRITDLFSFILDCLTLILLILTVLYAKRNVDSLSKEQIIKNKSDFLMSILKGMLNPLGEDYLNTNDSALYGVVKLKRLNNTGFYDGCRAILGDMMNMPFYSNQSKINAIENHQADCFFSAPSRFGISWDYLFHQFHDICKLSGVPSGLEEYIHDDNFRQEFHNRTSSAENWLITTRDHDGVASSDSCV